MSGLKSPDGRRGSICAHFGWSVDYLLHGIPWGTVERMIIDAPSVENTKDGGRVEVVKVTEQNAADILQAINNLER